ncbi:MAG: putative geopeptide radical SAM maturase [Nitrospirae bacterium]|nr:MAG: putative geopeptide radical SAM maturase [Nitrospirota bacterium]
MISNYCIVLEHKERPGRSILFSAKRASSVIVPTDMAASIKEGFVPEENRQALYDLKMIIDGAEEEKGEMKGFIERFNKESDKWGALLVLTLDCNLSCKYCFEDYGGSQKGDFYMTKETAEEFIFFAVERSRHKKQLSVTFYGGEPLLCMDMIEYVSANLRHYAEASGKDCSFSVITNGSLLTERNVGKLVSLGVKSAKVTLDGPPETHNHYRPFRNGGGSFDSIVRGIEHASNFMQIQIGGNYTESSWRKFPELLDYMIGEGLTGDKVSVRFSPVLGEGKTPGLSDFNEGCLTANEEWAIGAGMSLREEVLKRGYRMLPVRPSLCVIESDDVFTVNYNGDLYKCPGMLGIDGFSIGSLTSGIRDYRQMYDMENWKNGECLSCSYLPLCFGGCRYAGYLRNGKISGVDCRKVYYDKALAELVNQDIKYRLYR